MEMLDNAEAPSYRADMEMKPKRKDRYLSQPFHVLLFWLEIVGGVLIIGSIAAYLAVFHGGFSSDHLVWGSFGGYLGGILGPAFSLFTFIGVICTIYLQGKETAVNRKKEISDSRFRELLNALDAVQGRLKVHDDIVNNILEFRRDAPKEEIEWLPGWKGLRVCLGYMGYCINQLKESVSNEHAEYISDFYTNLYEEVVVLLYEKGLVSNYVMQAFYTPSPPEEGTSS
jgi:uncharacterized membrane protein